MNTISVLFLFFVFVWLIVKDKIINRHIKEIKCYLLTIYIVSLIIPTQYPIVELTLNKQPAAFGDTIYVATWHVLIMLIFIFPSTNVKTTTGNSIKWLMLFSLIAVSTYFNPYNANPTATIVGIYYILSLLVSSIIIYRRFNFDEILFAIWNAFIIIVIIELILAIAYPVLGLDAVTSIFYGDTEHAVRGDRPSAIGTFAHPGPLGLIMSFIFAFFAAHYVYGNRKRESLLFLILSGVIVILTQSRASYIVAALSLLFIYIFHKATNTAKIIRYSLSGIFILVVITYILVFKTSMGTELFLTGDFEDMQIARLVHWYVGWKAFTENMIMGTGLNAHLSYINDNISFAGLDVAGSTEFFETNPVHNTHLIILSELGLIGGLVWFYGVFTVFGTNVKTLVKMNATLPVNFSTTCKNIAISQIFTPAVIIVYSMYAFTGWATTHYYSLSLLLLSVILSEKCRAEHLDLIG